MLKKYAAEVGVPEIAPHDLRRTCAKLAGPPELFPSEAMALVLTWI
jgi:integrase